MRLRMGWGSWEQGTLAQKQPGTGNICPKTAGNRELSSKTQGPRNIGSKTAGNLEHWLKNSREPGTMALKALGTGNIDLKTAGTREHRTLFFRSHQRGSKILFLFF